MLQSMGSQRVRHDWVAKLNWTDGESEYPESDPFSSSSPLMPLSVTWIVAVVSESVSTFSSQHCHYIMSISAQNHLETPCHSIPVKALSELQCLQNLLSSFLWLTLTLSLLRSPGPTGCLAASAQEPYAEAPQAICTCCSFLLKCSFPRRFPPSSSLF